MLKSNKLTVYRSVANILRYREGVDPLFHFILSGTLTALILICT